MSTTEESAWHQLSVTLVLAIIITTESHAEALALCAYILHILIALSFLLEYVYRTVAKVTQIILICYSPRFFFFSSYMTTAYLSELEISTGIVRSAIT